jgi:hypothetical protein
MTAGAVSAEAAGVHVLPAVTTGTVLGDRGLQVPRTVAILALEVCMFAVEGEPGLPGMIKL